MRGFVIGLMTLSTVLSLAACGQKEDAKTAATPAPAGADPLAPPNPKAGLWQQTVTLNDTPTPMINLVCLDEATAAKLSAYGDDLGDMCPQKSANRAADGSWTTESTCNMGTGGTVKTTSKITGDFNSDYKIDSAITTTGAEVPQMNSPRTMTMSGKWMGACPADMVAGDIKMANGKIFNVGQAMGIVDSAK